jgi:phosphotransferase system  glucose/maltose/N-acetylglucosamine-specific IIC component
MISAIPLQFGIGALVSVFSLLSLIVHGAMILWTYSDAGENSSHPAVLWAIVVLFAPLIGFVLYFLIGRDRWE